MRDVPLRFSIDRSTCQRSHLSLVFCECLQAVIHKGDTDMAYKISPMYRESLYMDSTTVRSTDLGHLKPCATRAAPPHLPADSNPCLRVVSAPMVHEGRRRKVLGRRRQTPKPEAGRKARGESRNHRRKARWKAFGSS